MKHLPEPINLIIDLHAFTGACAGKHYYTLGLLDALNNHPLSRYMQFHLVSTAPVSNITLTRATWHYFSKSWYYVKLSRLTKTLPHARLLSPTSFIPPLLSFCPTVTIVYDTASLNPQSFARNKKAQVLESLLYPRVMARSKVILTISISVMQELEKLSPTSVSKVMVVYPPLRNFPQVNLGVLKNYSLEPNNYLLYVGTLEPRKNLLNLLEGYHQFLSQIPGKHLPPLVLAGKKGWQFQPIFDTIKKLKLSPNVIVVDSPSDNHLATLYAHCLFFCFVSLYEGFGMPVLEALSFGKAVLASDIAVLREVAQECSLRIHPIKPASIARGMHALYGDESLRHQLASHIPHQLKRIDPATHIDVFLKRLIFPD